MPDNGTDTSQRKETSGQKKKSSDSSRSKRARGHWSPSLIVKDLRQLSAAMQEGFATPPGNRANAISEAFKSAKADLEISSDEETHKRKIDCYAVRKYG